jgi:hypothetical protein
MTLIDELVELCQRLEFICSYDESLESNPEYESRDGDGSPWVHKRVKSIGVALNDQGGKPAMQAAWHELVQRLPGQQLPREGVDRGWHGIGSWLQ